MGLKDRIRVRLLKKVLNDPVLYDVITAIRGCDGGGIALKRLFTARIRYLAGLDPVNVEVDVRECRKVNLLMVYKALEEVSRTDTHCLDHIMLAIDTLRRLKLMDGEEAEMLQELATLMANVARGAIDRDTAREKIDELTKKYENLIKP